MKKNISSVLIKFCIIVSIPIGSLNADPAALPSNVDLPQQNQTEIITFTPPTGWHFAESKDLPKSVKVMVVGKGSHEFPPSINLGTENYSGTLKQYLKMIKDINASQGHQWKDLGTIRTQIGEASLSQVDSRTKWGDVRMMHVIFCHQNIVYIMTAAASKEDFPKFYKDFFAAFRSLRFTKT